MRSGLLFFPLALLVFALLVQIADLPVQLLPGRLELLLEIRDFMIMLNFESVNGVVSILIRDLEQHVDNVPEVDGFAVGKVTKKGQDLCLRTEVVFDLRHFLKKFIVPLLECAPFLQTGFQATLFASVISSARDKNFKGVTI